MKNKILQYVQKNDQVSFVELSRSIEGFSGDRELLLDGHPSIILWVGISNEAISAIGQLVNDDDLYIVPTDSLTYMIDGAGLNFPIAKNIRDYKKTRWLPVLFTDKKPNYKKFPKK